MNVGDGRTAQSIPGEKKGNRQLHPYFRVLLASIGTFATTNIDDAILLSLLFAKRIPARRIVAGQYLGFTIIVVASLGLAIAALAIPHRWIRFLGFVPVTLGVRSLLRQKGTSEDRTGHPGMLSIALVTASCGADNVGVYVPFFVFSRPYWWIILITYFALIAAWCLVARFVALRSTPAERWSRNVVPWVFILLGTLLLIEG
jgi:cadmium resistance protein CadD (predicted permease)